MDITPSREHASPPITKPETKPEEATAKQPRPVKKGCFSIVQGFWSLLMMTALCAVAIIRKKETE
jgi:hypothetical protein